MSNIAGRDGFGAGRHLLTVISILLELNSGDLLFNMSRFSMLCSFCRLFQILIGGGHWCSAEFHNAILLVSTRLYIGKHKEYTYVSLDFASTILSLNSLASFGATVCRPRCVKSVKRYLESLGFDTNSSVILQQHAWVLAIVHCPFVNTLPINKILLL